MSAAPPFLRRHFWTLLYAVSMTVTMIVTLQPYDGNVTALFHMDSTLAERETLPKSFVVLDMPGYDGMQYYQIARNIPHMINPADWPTLVANDPPGLNAYQRFLLPLAAFLLSFGHTPLLPYAFLAINTAALIGVFVIAKRRLSLPAAAALALSPAAMIGLHFSLAEPLTLLLITVFLMRYTERKRLQTLDIVLLSLIALSREVNILFIGGTFLYALLRRQWRDAGLLLIPMAVFLFLQMWIAAIFGNLPFFLSAAKRDLPLAAPLQLLLGAHGYNMYTLSSIALLLAFVLPTVAVVAHDVVIRRNTDYVTLMLLLFLAIMLAMPDFIWGSITSIGRVITPVYPLFAAYAAAHRSRPLVMLCLAVGAIGVMSAVGLALIVHPFHVT